jgi:hypothetical protein
MSVPFKQMLLEKFPLHISRKHYDQMHKYVLGFELRPGCVEGLNSALLGVENMFFLPKDVQALFDIFDVDRELFKKTTLAHPEVNVDFKVASDPYNIFVVYLVYLVDKSDLSRQQKDEFKLQLIKMLHYKFFTSVVGHQFPYKADRATMEKTIDSLNAKYDIKSRETPTWKLVIEKRSEDVIAPDSIHFKTLQQLPTFKDITYAISDMQTRIRSKVVNVSQRYYDTKKANDSIGTSSLVSTIDGEKNIKSIEASYDVMISTITNDALNVNKFIDLSFIDLVVGLTNNIKADMLKALLVRFSEMATLQSRKGEQNKVTGKSGYSRLEGYKVLISSIIQKTYRACVVDKEVNMKSRLHILQKANNLYKSSRINDEDILVIKNSVDAFVESCELSRRPSTNASLKIGFITYIILLSFRSQ